MDLRCFKTWAKTLVEPANTREQILTRQLELVEADLEVVLTRENDTMLRERNLRLEADFLQQQLDLLKLNQKEINKSYSIDVVTTISDMAKEACDNVSQKLCFVAWRSIGSGPRARVEQALGLAHDCNILTSTLERNLERADCREVAERISGVSPSASACPPALSSVFHAVDTPPSELRGYLTEAAALEEARARAKSLELELEKLKADHRCQMEVAEKREESLRLEFEKMKHFYDLQLKNNEIASCKWLSPRACEENSHMACDELDSAWIKQHGSDGFQHDTKQNAKLDEISAASTRATSARRSIGTGSKSAEQSQLRVDQTNGLPHEHIESSITPRSLDFGVDACTELASSPSVLHSVFNVVETPPAELRERLTEAAATLEAARTRAKSLELELEKMHRSQMEDAEQREQHLRNELNELKHFYESRQKNIEIASTNTCRASEMDQMDSKKMDSSMISNLHLHECVQSFAPPRIHEELL